MRPSPLRLALRPIPLSSIPANLVRLPPKPTKQSPAASAAASPTIDRLVANLSKRAAATVGAEASATATLPANLRIDEFVPRRREYAGVNKAHRTLVSCGGRGGGEGEREGVG